MILIPFPLDKKLFELDRGLQELGKNLYGRKLFREYPEENRFVNFRMELHGDGSFTLHFLHSILGLMENKSFGTSDDEVLEELEILISVVKGKLNLANS